MIYFTCGPSQLYPTVPKYIMHALNEDILSISHRSVQFQEIYRSAQNGLRKLLNIPKNHKIFFLSSSLESMERIIENCVKEYSFHFINGAFSKKFYEIVLKLKKHPEKYEVSEGDGYDPNKIKIPKRTELICITHNETSTGVSIPLQSINRLKDDYPKKLIVVDIVSSAPYPKIEFKKIDMAFFSVQKGFGLPAGLGILIVNERAIEKAKYLEKKGVNVGSYHSFSSLLTKDEIFQTPETPNVLAIYLLDKVVRDMLKKGINQIRKETDIKAKLVYDFFDRYPKYKPFVKEPQFRSKTTIVIDVKSETKKIIEKTKNAGFIISSGYGQFKQNHIRIANFAAHSLSDIQKLLSFFSLTKQ